jgi:GntR family transcriptional regulator
MFIRIETTSGTPMTRQIMDQIAAHIASEALLPGDRLPSVRELAKQLAVNQNTILRVYERLTTQGLLERRRGDGTYVADNLPSRQKRTQHTLLKQDAQRLADKAHALGLGVGQLHDLVEQAYAKSKTQPRSRRA